MARRTTQIVLLVGALLWWRLGTNPKTAKVAVPSSAPVPLVVSSSAPAPVTGNRSILPILESLRALPNTDQVGLDRLFSALRDWMNEDPKRAADFFDGNVSTFSGVPLEESFFLVHGFLHYGPEPEKRASAVLSASEARTPSNSHHVGEMTPAERLDRVKAFTLRHFPRTAEKGRELLPDLRLMASQSLSLDLAREAVLLLRDFSPAPDRDVEEAIQNRPEAERLALIP